MDIQTKDGILLRGIPDGTPDDVIKARIATIRAERPTAAPDTRPLVDQIPDNPPTLPERIAANSGVRFFTGASAPIRGMLEKIPGGIGQSWKDTNQQLSDMQKRGLMNETGAGKFASGTGEIAGEMLSPVSLGASKIAPAATWLGRTAQNAGIGGAFGLMAPTGNEGDPLVNGGLGAAAGVTVPAVLGAATKTGHVLRDATGPMRESWRTGQGNKFLREKLGPAVNDVIDAITQRSGQGGPQTTADLIAGANIGRTDKFGSPLVAIEDQLIRQPGGISDAAKSVWAKQEAGRRAALAAVTPDVPAAIAAREAASGPLYRQADESVATLGPQFQQLFERMPRGTLRKAADIARMEGKPFQIGQYAPATDIAPAQYPEMSGQALHYIKRALSDIANAPASAQGSGRDTQAAARGVLDEFVTAFGGDTGKGVRGAIPEYGAARAAYSAGSKPIEQAKVLTAMQDVLSGQGGPERVTPFMNVLGRGEQALLKKSTGFPRYQDGDLGKVLTGPGQMDAVSKVSGELTRDLERKALGQGVDTGNLFNIADKGKGTVSIPNLLSRPAMLANFVMKRLGHGADEMITRDMGNLMVKDPAAFAAKYLKEIPISERRMVIEEIARRGKNPMIGTVGMNVGSDK